MKKDNTEMSQASLELISGLESERVVKASHFLEKGERDNLFDVLCTNQLAFKNPELPNTEQEGSLYLSLDAGHVDQNLVRPIKEAFECLSDRILKILPDLFTLLQIEPFPVSKPPLTIVNGLGGHSGSPHADDSGDRFKISLLYYFHKIPKAFQGGDLDIYSSDPESPSGHSKEPIARIEQEDNLLLAFPSQTFHGISDVLCDSKDFADGRFVVVAFLGPK